MKTDLTRSIESSLESYRPTNMGGIKINMHRHRFTAFEVPVICGCTNGGLVDCVQVMEYFDLQQPRMACSLLYWSHNKDHREKLCDKGYLSSGKIDIFCDEPDCPYSRSEQIGVPEIMFVCYEIKISVADFKSKNGHNLVGNLNYYVIPSDIYEKVEKLVPDGVGIITMTSSGLRRRRDASFVRKDDDFQKWMLLNVTKRVSTDARKAVWDEREKLRDNESKVSWAKWQLIEAAKEFHEINPDFNYDQFRARLL